MAVTPFLEPSRLVITSDLTKKNVTQASVLARLVANELTNSVETQHLLPIELLTDVGKKQSRGAVAKDKDFKDIKAHGFFVEPQQIADYLTEHVSFVRRIHRDYYVALLRAMDQMLLKPGIAMSGDEVNTIRSVALPLPNRSEYVQVRVNWPGLARRTVLAKQGLAPPSRVFWRHTTRGRSAFHVRVRNKLNNNLDSLQFSVLLGSQPVGVITAEAVRNRVNVLSTRPGQGRNQYAAEMRFSYQIGVPYFGDQRMDALVTVPFATGKTDLGVFNLYQSVRNAPDWSDKLRGLDRLMAAEAFRPWLRQLSAQARANMLRSLQSGLVSRGQAAANIAGHQQAQHVKAVTAFKRAIGKSSRELIRLNRVQSLKNKLRGQST